MTGRDQLQELRRDLTARLSQGPLVGGDLALAAGFAAALVEDEAPLADLGSRMVLADQLERPGADGLRPVVLAGGDGDLGFACTDAGGRSCDGGAAPGRGDRGVAVDLGSGVCRRRAHAVYDKRLALIGGKKPMRAPDGSMRLWRGSRPTRWARSTCPSGG